MPALAEFLNSTGNLTFSSGGVTPKYLGTATYISSTPATNNGILDAGGFSTYQYTHAGQIVVALRLVNGRSTRLISISQSGSLWTILVAHEAAPIISGGFLTQYPDGTVYVFGVPVALAGSVGLALYDAGGVLKADLSAQPLTWARRLPFAAGAQNNFTLASALTTPAIVGMDGSGSSVKDIDGIEYANVQTWTISASGLVISRNFSQVSRSAEVPGGTFEVITWRASVAYLIEAAGL